MLRETIRAEGLGDRVTMLGAVATEDVRDVLVSETLGTALSSVQPFDGQTTL